MGISLLLRSGFRASGSSERELGCAIIRHAVRAWKKTEPGDKAYNELVRFFNGRWFEFLWSSLMNERVEVVLDALGVPGVTTPGQAAGEAGAEG
jgi:hypothetical protein